MALDLVGEVMDVDDGAPTETSGLGRRPLKGRMRVPSPAASTMARFGGVETGGTGAIESVLPLGHLN
jgi:hypothetical protein